ncbi:MAG TPA: class 1 fructose-bisphosphatase [Chitinophagales bacterium]|jgi:fructose-1,6-bisphosphatase I|nr:class 1 fructose-bisphosphatase [Chitinophagales bacterium]HQD12651.1 class 1 fructose-bisphosphatase [Chitinophagales bacterium]HQO30761.1 class 1 fructose-bisphosphatase [Chitinophagales bacterium]HQO88632.1 class 1 fructose-bisphosphatase [Chitinophagales bacterium]
MRLVTLDEFIAENQYRHPEATGELSGLLRDIGLAAKIVNRDLSKAGLVDAILGDAEKTNVQGEEVKKLDEFANEILIKCLQNSGECCGIASEEEDTFVAFENRKNAKYVVLFDPLDGSSNIDVIAPVGTIFSVFRRKSPVGTLCTLEDFLQAGDQQAAAGYVIYGSSTMLVYSTGEGVNGFTLDPTIGEFCLSHADIQTPKNAKTYSMNQGNCRDFPENIQQFVDFCQDNVTKKPYSLRYIGSMVADFHRNLLKGGVFLYPPTKSAPNGKLRLMYECNPMAYLQEQAGGSASNGGQRILSIQPTELHQRTPVYIGSEELVNKVIHTK